MTVLFLERLDKTPAPALMDAAKEMMAARTELDRLGIPATDPDTGEALDLARRIRMLGLEMVALRRDSNKTVDIS